MTKGFYQHYNREDHPFIDRALELIARVEERYSFELTSFLNPHQIDILRQIGAHHGLQVFSSAKILPSEYARAILAPSYYILEEADFEISLLEVTYPAKFYTLTHSQVLGTVLHQLGIERKSFGDILMGDGKVHLFVEQRFSSYFQNNLKKIAKVSVKVREVDYSKRLMVEEKSKFKDLLVTSIRLDKLVAATFQLSRSVASQLIQAGQVKVNYTTIDNPSRVIQLEDLISVRKYGRFKMVSENGLSKNGKHKLTVEVFSSKK
ncbi:RNA-binding protein [Streptococcus rubneri]|mgnify:FL=1|jgi:S4 domain-containing protein ylmH|uniref:RNA-binding protein n=1 Tax=Streptococcus rubneri TaxID=1234680 RepID=A0A4Z1DU84_9STRE|nr:YlmH/Sll1252 family protein [Streptococcus rubneri]MBK4775034.1 RNA-binding protein [Streptococcus rubneri]TGN91446.1 RNA-binding protein [Streptococcus rubneri]